MVNKIMFSIEIVFILGFISTVIIFHEDLNLNIIRVLYGTGSLIVMIFLLEIIREILNDDWTGHY